MWPDAAQTVQQQAAMAGRDNTTASHDLLAAADISYQSSFTSWAVLIVKNYDVLQEMSAPLYREPQGWTAQGRLLLPMMSPSLLPQPLRCSRDASDLSGGRPVHSTAQ